MLAMHYAFTLSSQEQVESVRTRARERGPLFDGFPGLEKKLFLIDPENLCYATFYLWRDPVLALEFLEGPFFKALSDTFGRPEVRLMLTRAEDLPFSTGDKVRLQVGPTASQSAVVQTIDPANWEHLSLAAASDYGQLFEVMYRAVGK